MLYETISNDMKEARYLIMVLMVLLCGESFAASPYKVEERSGRKPSWVGKTEKGYIIFSSTGSSLEEARDKCMESIKQEIVQAVAVNVSSEILSTSRQLSENGKYDLYEEYRSDIKSVAARHSSTILRLPMPRLRIGKDGLTSRPASASMSFV